MATIDIALDRIRALEAENKRLREALIEALDLFAYEFVHRDGSLVVDHTTGFPYNAGGFWVKQARAALAPEEPSE